MAEKLLTQFEQINAAQERVDHLGDSAAIVLSLAATAMKFARVERAPRYEDGRCESDAEHSYMLGLVANEIAALHYPELNGGLITQYALVHDLVELKTGDEATFQATDEALAQKAAREHAALDELLTELPPRTAALLLAYEQQADPESRLVKAIDKNLPIAVDILGQGNRVMRETYGIESIDQLHVAHNALRKRMNQRFSEFPEVVSDHDLLCELYELEFEASTQPH